MTLSKMIGSRILIGMFAALAVLAVAFASASSAGASAFDPEGAGQPAISMLTGTDGQTVRVENVYGTQAPTGPSHGRVSPDIHYTWGWISGTVYFNKHETSTLAAGGSVGAFLGCRPCGGLGAAAAVAVSQGWCVKAKWYGGTAIGTIGYYWGSSGDGYCR
jgi:hypothetical protein